MNIFLLTIGFVLLLVGLIGAFLPVLPGPPIAWGGLLVAFFSSSVTLHISTLVITAILMIVVTIADYVFPPMMTKKSGGTKAGSWGATIGLIVGFFLPLPIIGLILCPFFGAFIFELVQNPKDSKKAFDSAWGAFLGFLLGTGIKAIIVSCFIWILILNLLKGWF